MAESTPVRLWRMARLTAVLAAGGALAIASWAAFGHNVTALLEPVAFLRLLGGLTALIASYVVIDLVALKLGGADTIPSLGGTVVKVCITVLILRFAPVRELLLLDPALPLDQRAMLGVGGLGMVVVFLLVRRFFFREPTDAELEREWPFVPLAQELSPGYEVLVVDGTCAFCTGAARFVLGRDTRGTVRIATRDSAFAAGLFERHPELRGTDSVLWVTGDAVLGEWVQSRWGAVAAIGRYLGGGWGELARSTTRFFPRRLLDWGYDVVAARRHRLMAGESCTIPRPANARRLLA